MKVIIKDISIGAISAYLPTSKVELCNIYKHISESEISKVMAATGIEEVRIADVSETSSDMCFNAAVSLLKSENVESSAVDGIVFVSQTPDYILPATSVILQDRLGCSKDTICQDIHYGCSGYIYGLLQASLWINSGLCNRVLLMAGDTTSRMINPMDKSLRMVFGDAGTATLLTKGSNEIAFNINSDGSGYDRLIVPAGGFRTPKSEFTAELISDSDGNSRTPENLYMDGIAIFNFAINNVHKNIESLLNLVGWEKDSVTLFALHQANDFMVNYVRKKLKVDKTKVPTNVKKLGNTGPATIPLLFADLYGDSQNNMLERVVMSGFGVGLSWGSVAANLSETRFYTPINKL